MSSASNFFRPVPIESPIHSLAAETKIVAGVLISIGLVFNPQWSHIIVAIVLVALTFRLARLPLSILPKIPYILRYAILGSLLGAVMSGDDPVVFGFGIGGLLDYLRLFFIGILMIFWTGILSWTTGLNAIGFALRRLISPLGRIGFPVEEVGTVIALAVRSLPLVADEVDVVNETVHSRPPDMDLEDQIMKQTLSYMADTSATVVVGSHRRARDLAKAMVSRGSHQAPNPPAQVFSTADKAVLVLSLFLVVAAFVIPGWPPPAQP